jgi:DNA modification methylase
VKVIVGDCVNEMADMPEASVDAIVTDPPYGISFMGKEWDGPAGMLGLMAFFGIQTAVLAIGLFGLMFYEVVRQLTQAI